MKTITLLYSTGHSIQQNVEDSVAEDMLEKFSDASTEVIEVPAEHGTIYIKKYGLSSLQISDANTGEAYLGFENLPDWNKKKWVFDRTAPNKVRLVDTN